MNLVHVALVSVWSLTFSLETAHESGVRQWHQHHCRFPLQSHLYHTHVHMYKIELSVCMVWYIILLWLTLHHFGRELL